MGIRRKLFFYNLRQARIQETKQLFSQIDSKEASIISTLSYYYFDSYFNIFNGKLDSTKRLSWMAQSLPNLLKNYGKIYNRYNQKSNEREIRFEDGTNNHGISHGFDYWADIHCYYYSMEQYMSELLNYISESYQTNKFMEFVKNESMQTQQCMIIVNDWIHLILVGETANIFAFGNII